MLPSTHPLSHIPHVLKATFPPSVSNAIEGKFKIDNHEFKQELTDVDSEDYKKMVKDLEAEVSVVASSSLPPPSLSSSSAITCHVCFPTCSIIVSDVDVLHPALANALVSSFNLTHIFQVTTQVLWLSILSFFSIVLAAQVHFLF